MKPEILFLKQEDVIAAGLLDMKNILAMVEKTYYMDGKGQVNNPVKTVVSIPEGAKDWESHFISMPVHIAGDVNRPGIKWAAESAANLKTGGIPMGIDIIILSDPVTVLPVSIMDGTLITAMRTSAAAGVAAKHLAPRHTQTAACMGAGVIGRTMIMSLNEALPTLKKIKLYDLNLEKAQGLAAEFDGVIEVVPVGSVAEATDGVELIATMTTSRVPFVKPEHVPAGATVIQMGPSDIEPGIIEMADKIVVDSWPQIKNNSGSVFYGPAQSGAVGDDDIAHLKEVVAGYKPGRESDEETIVFGSLGMGCLDIMVANHLYEQAKLKGVGQKLLLWDEPKWV